MPKASCQFFKIDNEGLLTLPVVLCFNDSFSLLLLTFDILGVIWILAPVLQLFVGLPSLLLWSSIAPNCKSSSLVVYI